MASARNSGRMVAARVATPGCSALPVQRGALLASGRPSARVWGGLPRRAPVPQLDSGAGSGAGAGAGGRGGRVGFSGRGSGAGGDSGAGGGLWSAYNALLAKHPLLVKAITTAVLSALGNVICQVGIERVDALDGRRIGIFTALGLLWVAPCLHFWFGALNRWAGSGQGACMLNWEGCWHKRAVKQERGRVALVARGVARMLKAGHPIIR